MEKLRSLLGSLDKPIGACSLALLGTLSFSFCINASNRFYDDYWVIDSGATDYMTSKSQLFHTYTPSLPLSLKMSSMYQNCRPTLFPFKSLLMILNVMLYFPLLIVFFRNRARGGGLNLVRKGTVFTTLNHLRKLLIICLCLFSVPQIKIPYGCITYV